MTSPETERLALPAFYHLVPPAEIHQRLGRLQQALAANHFGAAIFLQYADIFYLTGT
ncbi:MAG: hypothetical protein JRJ56_08910, partial [Deltaproteobacteria bacterium]|nr:hypothetical protein [Deltaproteobacteria bacterium]